MAYACLQRLRLNDRCLHLDAVIHFVTGCHSQFCARSSLLALEGHAVLAELARHPLAVHQVPAVTHPPCTVRRASALQLGKLVHRVVFEGVDILVLGVLCINGLTPLLRLLLVKHADYVVVAQSHVLLALACAVQSMVHFRHNPHELLTALQQVPQQRVVACIAVHVRTCNLRLTGNVPAEAHKAVIVQAQDGIVVIVDEEPYLAVFCH